VRNVILSVLIGLSLVGPAVSAPRAPQLFRFEPFGQVSVYRPQKPPSSVALFLSGDGGWNQGVVDMAQHLVEAGALVVGIDVNAYRKGIARPGASCVSLAQDLERLSHDVQRDLAMPRYITPVVVGYSSGATMAYAAIAQAPSGTFRGALSIGFCPDFPLEKPLCRAGGLVAERGEKSPEWLLKPDPTLDTTWIALQGGIDQVCSADSTAEFASAIPRAELVPLPHVGHGFSVERNWLPQFRAAFMRLAASMPTAQLPSPVADLPITEVPSKPTGGEWLAVMLSGDGGWAGLDKAVAADLAAHGVAVVGVSSLEYFWRARTPEQAGADLARILETYLAAWHRQRAVVIGYSFGAEVAPFMVNRLPAAVRDKVHALALIGPGQTATFQFHVSEWLGRDRGGLMLRPEIDALAGTPLLCLHGVDETDSLCPALPPALATNVQLAGGHHYGGDYTAISSAILDRLLPAARPPPPPPPRR
jgi:type IV secretory pathway VirJ component